MVMFVRALNVEAGSFVFVFKDVISGTVLGGCWIASSADLVGSTGREIVQVSFAFLLAFAAASLFRISFLSRKFFRRNSFCFFSSNFAAIFSLQSSSVNTRSSMITLGGLIFSSCLTGCRISARSGDINPVETNEFWHAPGSVEKPCEVAGVILLDFAQLSYLGKWLVEPG